MVNPRCAKAADDTKAMRMWETRSDQRSDLKPSALTTIVSIFNMKTL